jgi:uncharacterized protein YwqG
VKYLLFTLYRSTENLRQISQTVSKIGGGTLLPSGFRWPLNKKGNKISQLIGIFLTVPTLYIAEM